MARRILTCEPRSLYVATIAFAASSPAEFRRWRRKIHNVICYRRRRSRWWRSVGIWGWHDGADLNGIVELGTISTIEFKRVLRRHGEIHLRPITNEDIRTEVYTVARSIPVTSTAGEAGRYQPIKIAIEPVPATARSKPTIGNILIEPLPIIF